MRNLKCSSSECSLENFGMKSFHDLRTENMFGMKNVKSFRFDIKPIKFNTKSYRLCITLVNNLFYSQ
jgi:hypothetical protein